MEPVLVVSKRETVLKNHWKMGYEFGICYWSFLPLRSIFRIATIDTSSRPTNYQSADQVKKKTISDRDKEDLSMVVKKRKQKAAYCRCLATAQIPVPLGPEIQIKSRVIGFPKLTFFLQPSDMPVT
jgi:hypothetical protein